MSLWLTEADTAAALGLSVNTLRKKRSTEYYPGSLWEKLTFLKVDNKISYLAKSVENFKPLLEAERARPKLKGPTRR